MRPVVSFVVPCYKLAHTLSACIGSILRQTYRDFEVLILDDCSPDDTPAVARSFGDPRVVHIRHNHNRGHLQNYNEGISRCKGRYIWLISADDVLLSPHILERYVDTLDRYPRAGFVFCPAIAVRNDREGELLQWSYCGNRDRIWGSKEFLSRIMRGNCVVAASGMARRECYEKVGLFPLDLPYAGDWYLWAAFSLYFDVAYLNEPMVGYRLHEVSMTNTLARQRRLADNNTVPWRILRQAELLKYGRVARTCTEFLAGHYAYCVSAGVFGFSDYSMTMPEMEESLGRYEQDCPDIARLIRARVHSVLADGYWRSGNVDAAALNYSLALGHKKWLPKTWIKWVLVHAGAAGHLVRAGLMSRRSRANQH